MTTKSVSAPGDSVGACAATRVHVPIWPSRLHCWSGSAQAVLQQTPSSQKPVEHSDGVVQSPPWGMPVLVGVTVTVLVDVSVGVLVGVLVAVVVDVTVGVGERTGTPSITSQSSKPCCPHVAASLL